MTAIPTLLITGPVGVGKTTVAVEVSELLEKRNVPHAVIDLDSLSWSYPPPPDDRFRNRLTLRNLAAIWPNYSAAGTERLVLARVIESRSELDPLRAAVPGAEIQVVRLRASPSVLQERVRRRELGSGRDWHVRRPVELAQTMDHQGVEDYVVETDGQSVAEVAARILEVVGWLE